MELIELNHLKSQFAGKTLLFNPLCPQLCFGHTSLILREVNGFHESGCFRGSLGRVLVLLERNLNLNYCFGQVCINSIAYYSPKTTPSRLLLKGMPLAVKIGYIVFRSIHLLHKALV